MSLFATAYMGWEAHELLNDRKEPREGPRERGRKGGTETDIDPRHMTHDTRWIERERERERERPASASAFRAATSFSRCTFAMNCVRGKETKVHSRSFSSRYALREQMRVLE